MSVEWYILAAGAVIVLTVIRNAVQLFASGNRDAGSGGPFRRSVRPVVSPRARVLAAGLARHVRFGYRPLEGGRLERRAVVHRVEEYEGVLYFVATCLAQREPRTFRADRADGLTDLKTGEAVADLEVWLRALHGREAQQTARSARRAGAASGRRRRITPGGGAVVGAVVLGLVGGVALAWYPGADRAHVAPAQVAADVSGVARVLDGDTMEVAGARIRLFGIDAPESAQRCTRSTGESWPCGREATAALRRLADGARVDCIARDRDAYGRLVAVCHKDGLDINGWMVSEGWAVAYRYFAADYVPQERSARAAARNIWGGDFQLPWNWRRSQSAS